MKKYIIILLTALACTISCRKESSTLPQTQSPPAINTLSLSDVQAWYNAQNTATNLQTQSTTKTFSLHQFSLDWNKAGNVTTPKRNWWTLALPGQTAYKGLKQGYRKLVFTKDSTGAIQARILEIIPDAAYLHIHHGADTKTFTGLVFVYNQQYQLQKGMVYNNGKQVGAIRPKAITLNATASTKAPQLRTDMVAISESCDWIDDNYIDGEGVVTIYSYQVCDYEIYDDGMDGGGGGGAPSGDPLGSGGGGGGSEASAPDAPVDLPDQPKAPIDPKAFMNCFGSLPDQGAKETITVYVQEPQPGLPFNYGVNSVGHTAISLTKTVNGQSITQTVGFYPTSSKLAATGTSAKIVDNTNLNYTVSVSYSVLPFEFNAIANFIANPPSTYNLYTYNCTNFVYDACSKGDITLPDPNGNMGFFQTGMTPAALGGSIRDVSDILKANTNGGTVGQSHGPCN
ncbi:hypothetical protein [Mucilaginibacter sp. PPCGB 2223]|uniref:hypothetical protein n=1 Tax=Mucilaginibacter sp. PPCGB 2223 TaxID=1886027 RepID=UPI001111C4B6|nr:hypothetical protein [Mucilaginibacter sp. PPCGB 2223]